MKKFIAPLIFGILFVALVSAYLFVFVDVFKSPIVFAVYILVVGALAAAMIVTLVRRFREIKEEEKEDLSKY